ncbi:maltokinase [Marmoricola sp. URHA0025 HA25]
MTHEDARNKSLTLWVGDARWFGGKGRDFEITAVREIPLADGVTTTLVTVSYADGGSDLYQVPISSYDDPQERLGHAMIGDWDDRFHYDAVHDREAMHGWLAAFAVATPSSPHGSFHRVEDRELDLDSHSTLFSGEQSNSSVAFGEDSLMKVFRRITPGTNPDIEVHEALTRAGNTHVAQLYGYVAADDLHLAMLQQFLRTASDGWDLALVSARNLFAEGDLHADEVGGDFAGEAYRLGAAVAEVHELLAEEFPTEVMDLTGTAAGMRDRLTAALDVAPGLAEHRDGLLERFDAIAAIAPGPHRAQRVHGDLHLGQTLRTSLGWKLVDFEGEPAKDLSERRLPDSGWRDVAGMLRSFDYAARAVARDMSPTDDDEAAQIAYRAEEWVTRNTTAFLDGYVGQRDAPLDDDERALITAYVADKAVYEAVYETRNRPTWLDIPLVALHRIAEGTTEYATSIPGTESR